jgi:hypothetical protein
LDDKVHLEGDLVRGDVLFAALGRDEKLGEERTVLDHGILELEIKDPRAGRLNHRIFFRVLKDNAADGFLIAQGMQGIAMESLPTHVNGAGRMNREVWITEAESFGHGRQVPITHGPLLPGEKLPTD